VAPAPEAAEVTLPAPAPSAAPAPVTTLAASRSTPTPPTRAAPLPETPKARPASAPDETAGLLSQADAALAQRRYDEASGGYEEVLTRDSQSERAREGLRRAAAGIQRLHRVFVAEATSIQSRLGFEAGQGPRLSARLDFETVPSSPRPGEPYTVRVYLANLGKRSIKVASLNVVTRSGDSRSGGALAAESLEVGGGKRARLLEQSEAWEDTVSWSLQVTVTTPEGESFTSRLVWK
jgi:hypothetical protein